MRFGKPTLADVRIKLRACGMVISRDTASSGPTGSGEYQVTFSIAAWDDMDRSRAEDLAYYTSDLSDALQTGLLMAKEQEAIYDKAPRVWAKPCRCTFCECTRSQDHPGEECCTLCRSGACES